MSESKRIGKYEIIAELGRGGFAVVYKARDTELDRVVALKVLHPHFTTDPKFVQRFHQEARTAAGLHHAHIVTVHDDRVDGRNPLLAATRGEPDPQDVRPVSERADEMGPGQPPVDAVA